MNYKTMLKVASSLLFSLGIMSAAVQAETVEELLEEASPLDWRTPDPENVLYMDLPSGRVVIEMRPDFAPKHVEQVRTLARSGFYNGIIFHRVIEGFMAQGGDPTATGTGGSDLPDIPAEFFRDANEVDQYQEIGRDFLSSNIGFSGPIAVSTQPESLKELFVRDGLAFWGLHCPGVMSMARAGDPNSANSQFFLMFGDARDRLDQKYTIWGKIIDGFEHGRRINRGEPPERPTPIIRVQVESDVPLDERENVQVLRTDTDVFLEYLKLN